MARHIYWVYIEAMLRRAYKKAKGFRGKWRKTFGIPATSGYADDTTWNDYVHHNLDGMTTSFTEFPGYACPICVGS